MPGKEPNKEDAPYRPWKPGPHDKPPTRPKPKLAQHVNAHDKDAARRNA